MKNQYQATRKIRSPYILVKTPWGCSQHIGRSDVTMSPDNVSSQIIKLQENDRPITFLMFLNKIMSQLGILKN
jgi:hypothetical protein